MCVESLWHKVNDGWQGWIVIEQGTGDGNALTAGWAGIFEKFSGKDGFLEFRIVANVDFFIIRDADLGVTVWALGADHGWFLQVDSSLRIDLNMVSITNFLVFV